MAWLNDGVTTVTRGHRSPRFGGYAWCNGSVQGQPIFPGGGGGNSFFTASGEHPAFAF